MDFNVLNSTPPSARIQPLCPVFNQCGGCLFQDIAYREELEIKERSLCAFLQETIGIESSLVEPIVQSPKEYHYRSRLDLRLLKTKEQKVFVGFSPKDRFGVVEVDHCPIALEEISAFIPQLKQEAKERLPAKYRLANLVLRRGDGPQIHWGGIGRGSLNLDEQSYFWTTINGRKIFYSLDTFFQANLSILPSLFDRIRKLGIWQDQTVLYDLYGGVGLFSMGLQGLYQKAYLIEECQGSIKLARYNKKYHDLSNIEIIAGRVEDHVLDLLIQHESSQIAMIDPPRAGLSDQAVQLLAAIRSFDHLLYLSCNPTALVRDLQHFLNNDWRIKKIIPFDFFPKTKHLETLVWLESKREG